jgi:hypothetical protein
MKKSLITVVFLAALIMAMPLAVTLSTYSSIRAAETVMVTVENFVRAETDFYMARYAAQGEFGTIRHIREPTPIDRQDVIRMNRDTLYSAGIFDLTHPVTIVKPESADRFQSMQIINQDHSTILVEHDTGKFTFTKEQIGTRYVIVLFRTFADPADATDVKKANILQDQIRVEQKAKGNFEIPDWDENSLKTVRDAIIVLASTMSDASGAFGKREELNPVSHLLGTAAGWGGNPRTAAMYTMEFPAKNDGKIPYSVTVRDVPVDGFWSITVYNASGFMEKNDLDLYSFNNITAKPNTDGSITINFGGDPKAINYLPITPGWNYTVRMYQPRKQLLDGSWAFPLAEQVK